ncbi:uncharacterized protein LOC143022870 [Oratosquilla oratoria]|uniref:uncharacterized protein LOC143022870 n=1 Tax=Oratosquilla oratoria TaxID=337810 RepID=UPI003F773E6A
MNEDRIESKRPRSSSVIWENFEKVADSPGNAKCLICGAVYHYSQNSSDLINHLSAEHGSSYESAKEQAISFEPASSEQSKRPRSSSVIWKHFEKVADSPDKAKCLICGAVYQHSQNTSNLIKHLCTKHVGSHGSAEQNISIKPAASGQTMDPSSSLIWEHFEKVANSPGKAKCLICGVVYQHSRNTTNLIKHLSTQHGSSHESAEQNLSFKPTISGQTKSPRSISMIWEHFEKVSNSPGKAKCLICGVVYQHSQNTSNLIKHLNTKHKGLYESAKDQNISLKPTTTDQTKSPRSSSMVWEYFDRVLSSPGKAKCIICGTVYQHSQNTSNLIKHLSTKHGSLLASVEPKLPIELATSEQPKHPRSSGIWEHFEKVANSPGKAKCLICGTVYQHSQNTSNLIKHLNTKHSSSSYESAREQNVSFEPATPGQTKCPRSSSMIWEYFERVYNSPSKAKCLICGAVYQHSQNTSNLIKHLSTKHGSIYESVKEQKISFEPATSGQPVVTPLLSCVSVWDNDKSCAGKLVNT